jgi:dipeptidyl-peptidase-4
MKNINITSCLLIFILLYLPVNKLPGQEHRMFTLEEIFLDQRFTSGPDGISDWMPDGNHIINVNPANDRIFITDVNSAVADTVVRLRDISGLVRPNARIGRHFLSDDGKMILFEVTERSVNKLNIRYFIKGIESEGYSEMVDGIAGKRLLNPAFSPDNMYISYIIESDIYIYDLRKGKSERLTTDGSRHIINGNSTVSFASVMTTPGYKWSPDSREIAFIRFDTEKVGVFKMINNTDSIYPRIIEFQHVKPGENLPGIRLIVKNIDDGSEEVICEGPSEAFCYVTWYGWIGKNELLVKQLNRNQNRLNIVRANVTTGNSRIIWSDSDDAFLMPFEMFFTAGGRSFLALSEKEGWRRLYLIDTETGEERCITKGDYDVESIEGIDKENRLVYFIASPDNAIYRYLWRVSLNNDSDPVNISPGKKGVHTYDIAPNGKYAYHSYSTMDTPPVTTLENLRNQKVLRVMQDNHRLRELLSEKLISKTEFIKIDIGNNITLDAWMIKPPDFNPSKKYPLITHVYSMPGNAVVRDRWLQNNYLWYQLLAQRGFIVMNIDSRGTPSLYGRDWRKVIYLKHGILPSDEQALAVKKIIRDYPCVDSSRIGIYGWSGGGLVSLLQILRYPDIYKVAIPGAYITDHRMYHAGFTERFLGLPQDNPEAYDLTAAVNYAGGLKGDLLLIHGTGDDNVHYQNTELLINKLVDEGKRFFVIPYPNISHDVKRDQDTYYHLFDTYLWFFTTRLAGTSERMND